MRTNQANPAHQTVRDRASTDPSKRKHVVLSAIQVVLALVFIFAGASKLVMPAEALAHQSPLPVAFLRFIGVCETFGALGLILPGVLRMKLGLTPIAAAGLVMIMVGATIVTLAIGGGAGAVVPFVVGSLAAFVARGRRGWITQSAPVLRSAMVPAR